MQVEQRRTGVVAYELLRPIEPERGLAMIPEPSPGDIFFDLEGDPFATDDGLEYLWGVIDPMTPGRWRRDLPPSGRTTRPRRSRRSSRSSTSSMRAAARRPRHARLPLRAVRADRAQAADGPLRDARGRGRPAAARRRVRRPLPRRPPGAAASSQESYSIKKLEPLYRLERAAELSDAGSSILAYEKWLELGRRRRARRRDPRRDRGLQPATTAARTWRLRDWLEERRDEVASATAWRFLGRCRARPSRPPRCPSEAAEAEALAAELTAGVSDDPAERSDDEQARWLLAQLLDWHRREDKRRVVALLLPAGTDGRGAGRRGGRDRRADAGRAGRRAGQAGAGVPVPIRPVAGVQDRSRRHAGRPAGQSSAGKVDGAGSPRRGTIELRRQLTWDAPHPTSLVPTGPIDTKSSSETR